MQKRFVGLVTLYQILQVKAWSAAGHQAVAEIAFNLMDTAKSTEFVRRTLQLPESADLKAEMKEKSVWADKLRLDPKLGHTMKFHYLSMSSHRKCKTVAENDCGRKGCIIRAIAKYTMEAIDHGLSSDDREEALKFVLHLMGDIAIPVHVGFDEDDGGNRIEINMAGKKLGIDADSDDDGHKSSTFNLHGIWDKFLPQNADLATTVAEISRPQQDDMFDRLTPNDINYNSMVAIATRMADETHSIACNMAYRHADGSWIRSGDKLEPEYWTSRAGVAKKQIQRAGIRLAKLIDLMAVADGRINKNVTKNNNPSSGSSANVSCLLFVGFWGILISMH